MSDRPDELMEAVKSFKEFENSNSHAKKINNFKDAINLLDEYVEENPNSPHINFVENIKTSHARILLEQLNNIRDIEIDDWFNYFILITQKLKSEVEKISSENPILKKGYQDFVAIWRADVLEYLTKLENGK
jgi:hypothetical protein